MPSKPHSMDSLQGKKKIFISIRLLTLMVIVFFLGILLKLDLWTQSDFNRTFEGIPSVQIKKESIGKGGRSPSSLKIPSNIKSDEGDSKMKWPQSEEESSYRAITVEWDCSKNKTFRFNNVGQLRLNGKCLKNIKRIINNRNGYTASLFKLDGSATTDFMSLNLGSNPIQIEWNNGASSKHSKELEIIVEKQ